MKTWYWMFVLVFAVVANGQMVLAQSIDFEIVAHLEAATCTPTLSGDGVAGNTLTLPNGGLDKLDAAGKTTGDTVVTFSLIDCAMSDVASSIWVYFHGAADPNGRLIPAQSNQLRFEILDVPSSGIQERVRVNAPLTNGGSPANGHGSLAGFSGSFPHRNADKSYVFRYYANEPVTDAGAMTASVMYTVMYY